MNEVTAALDVSQVFIRAVAPGDLEPLEALLEGLDSRSRYRRWFTPVLDVHRAAIWAADPELKHAVGLIAIVPGGELIGHAALVPIDGDRAEVCFEVASAWRQHGVAGRLLDELERRAAQIGVNTLVAEVLAENADMLAVLREHGPCRERRERGVVGLELAVAPPREPTVER